MREILFRAKRKDNGKWVYGSYVKYTDYDGIMVDLIFTGNGNPNDVIPETVGQYTGLTDKNGKMIFEGDIVIYAGEMHEVVFETQNNSAYFGVKIAENETWHLGHYVEPNRLEVIGNIHDNPNLLEVQDE